MSKRRTYNWPQLFVKFCKQRDINPKYFSLKRSQREEKNAGALTKAIMTREPISPQGLILEVGSCKIHCPDSMPLPSFISLVQSLA